MASTPKARFQNVDRPKAAAKKVTLVIYNNLKGMHFRETQVLEDTTKRTLFEMLQEAADINPKFRFSSKFYNRELGFFIETINGVSGIYEEDKSWWEILDGNMEQTPVGASSYEPRDGETVTFRMVCEERAWHSKVLTLLNQAVHSPAYIAISFCLFIYLLIFNV